MMRSWAGDVALALAQRDRRRAERSPEMPVFHQVANVETLTRYSRGYILFTVC